MNRSQQQICIDGKHYTLSQLHHHISVQEDGELKLFIEDLYHFLEQWFSETDSIEVHTSGSTGSPKRMLVSKQRMMQSARLTCEFLHLLPGSTTLLCMPLRYIAGKMMVVRALVAQLNLLLSPPSGHPLANISVPVDFSAMVPLQVFNSMQLPIEEDRLKSIGTLIIGGGVIDATIESELRHFPGAIYSTYGMTETLSHIALRRVSGPSASSYYQPFSSVDLSLSSENTLIINAPLVAEEILYTNDVARIQSDGSFEILGRKDNIVNSGGIKIQIEEVETILKPYINTPFAMSYVVDSRLGQALVLLSEDAAALHLDYTMLPPYKRPKYMFVVKQLPLTGTGKIDRLNCHLLAEQEREAISL